ncbi:type IV pilus twitching motility protein PilT [Desulfomonile tiedjei]|uniref:Pilus retraction protein PilT n=1 Tax=Desulfomonile tiedjei (strain ATCC 49306 / DSM 6799 / DCB-1) TaxID=706587 RepID=I4C2U7_DESTA|nr:type IV pilus twitching motility protein PilT [Desulfomonile tiedjei]AFM23888.1 pilus retraction protein PilT [Desulfomonile tiedjei DSM 6799]
MDLDECLRKAIESGASDIHLKVPLPPVTRINGVLAPMRGEDRLSPDEVRRIALSIMNERQREIFTKTKELDMAYSVSKLARFRVNVFSQRDSIAMVFRTIPSEPPMLKDLSLPPVIEKIAMEHRGLVLVTGTTGSGKSTTLAAMINHINSFRNCHLITIEDPIEFLHRDRKSIINQREVGQDTLSFQSALRAALREDPDVILVGEMRDLETIEIAMLAAETGHLVFSTLHTLDATETINRIISAFPIEHQGSIRLQLAGILKGVISQRLLSKADGKGRVPAVEVLVSTARIRECIGDERRIREIRDAIAEGHISYGMQTFDQSLMQLYKKNLVTYETALGAASNPDDFALFVRGISGTSEGKWDMSA